MKVAIVTPTIGSSVLSKCVDSVSKQTHNDFVHYIFIDGKEHENKVLPQLASASKVRMISLEENVGKGWYGHRVYAACSFLVNADVVCYLDEDNWIEPDHVENLVKVLETNQWAYTLRKIYDKDGNYLCDDNCESLGKWPVYFDEKVHHIDTSCFAVRKEVAVKIGHAWYGQWGADRQFFANIARHFPNYDCTNKHTLCYRLDGNPNSVTKEFFQRGNAENEKKYNGVFPWVQQKVEYITLTF